MLVATWFDLMRLVISNLTQFKFYVEVGYLWIWHILNLTLRLVAFNFTFKEKKNLSLLDLVDI